MKCVMIHGQSHEGSTCNIARMLAKKLDAKMSEFFLPRDFNEFCLGCTVCFEKGQTHCPHYGKLEPIIKAMDEADVIILESPVYVYHATGAMKAFLDHLGCRWMAHRPEESMFKKQAVVISTAAGAGMKSTNKDMADSTFFWGCARTYKLGFAVRAVSWEGISEKYRAKIEKKVTKTADKIKKRNGRAKPKFKTKLFFSIMRTLHKKVMNPADTEYWKAKGWLDKKRPW